jgi:microcystin-dependent protein
MANYVATKYNFSGASLTGIEGVNTGIVVPWGSASIPTGFLECNGQAVSRSTYAALFAVVGTTYGAGDGSTTFLVPDLQDRTIVNKSNTKTLAQTGGANTVTPTGNISGSTGSTTLTTAQIASHSHPINNVVSGCGGSQTYLLNSGVNLPMSANINTHPTNNTGGGQSHDHNLSANFVGGSTSTLSPYLVLIYIIKT